VGHPGWMHRYALGRQRISLRRKGAPIFFTQERHFGFGLSFSSFSLEWATEGFAEVEVALPLEELDAALKNVSFMVTVKNTGKRAGKETVMAYWSPPKLADPDLKQQLFDFQGVHLAPGESATLTFQMPASTSLATVTEAGDRVFFPGTYSCRFSRGHGVDLTKAVMVTTAHSGSEVSSAPLMLSAFPSRWVEGHEVSVDACIEGTTDVIPHTEEFLVDYKQFEWIATSGEIRHLPSGMCLTGGNVDSVAHLFNCSSTLSNTQKWVYSATKKTFSLASSGGCLVTFASSTGQLRVNLTVTSAVACATPTPSMQWVYQPVSQMVQSAITNRSMSNPDFDGQSPLCLAARSEGKFNVAS